jgi:primary-amine oxidase
MHLLDPLTAAEITIAADAVRAEADHTDAWRVVFILPYEPEKSELRDWECGRRELPARTALVVVRDKGEVKRTLELVVDLGKGAVTERAELSDVQPAVMREESVEAERLTREHPDWQTALRRRGVTDPSLAIVDHMPLGYQNAADGPQRRMGIALTWMRAGSDYVAAADDNGYARPVEGLIAYLDLDEMRVIKIEDHGGPPIPVHGGNYSERALRDPGNVAYVPEPTRPAVARLDILQPDGPGFTVDGWHVSWQNWNFRVGFNQREGLVLHDVRYRDRGQLRRVLHRASLSEMFVPYADPGITHFRKQLFDQGEAGIGRCTNSLRLGCDCLGEIYYFDAVIHDNDGRPVDLPQAVCMHEEDYGLLWKHTNLRTREPESRRGRRLVVSSLTTVGNYDYGFFWYFYQDGRIEFEAKLTGILSTGAYSEAEPPLYGTPLAPGLYGPNHQHWFNIRLDMAVDGDANTLMESNSEAITDPQVNYFGGAWRAHEAVLASELLAQRDIEPRTARYWKVVNEAETNAMGHPRGYALMPGHTAFHLYQSGAPAIKRAAFITHHLWATAYRRRELYAAGDHPNQHPGGDGLPKWTSRDANLRNADLVLWYTFATHHIPRPEDWPVMPTAYAGFELRPVGFFDANPAVDLPAESHACHGE